MTTLEEWRERFDREIDDDVGWAQMFRELEEFEDRERDREKHRQYVARRDAE